MQIQAKYITDSEGNRLSVLLDIQAYKHLLEELEELDAIRAYDAAKQSSDDTIPFEQAITEIENQRQ